MRHELLGTVCLTCATVGKTGMTDGGVAMNYCTGKVFLFVIILRVSVLPVSQLVIG